MTDPEPFATREELDEAVARVRYCIALYEKPTPYEVETVERLAATARRALPAASRQEPPSDDDELPSDVEFLAQVVKQWQSGEALPPEMVEWLLAKAGAGPPYGDPPRELHCEDCQRDYVVWFAPNELWNRVVRSKYLATPEPFLCPTCFTVRCDATGVEYTAFELRVETPATSAPPSEPPHDENCDVNDEGARVAGIRKPCNCRKAKLEELNQRFHLITFDENTNRFDEVWSELFALA